MCAWGGTFAPKKRSWQEFSLQLTLRDTTGIRSVSKLGRLTANTRVVRDPPPAIPPNTSAGFHHIWRVRLSLARIVWPSTRRLDTRSLQTLLPTNPYEQPETANAVLVAATFQPNRLWSVTFALPWRAQVCVRTELNPHLTPPPKHTWLLVKHEVWGRTVSG